MNSIETAKRVRAFSLEQPRLSGSAAALIKLINARKRILNLRMKSGANEQLVGPKGFAGSTKGTGTVNNNSKGGNSAPRGRSGMRGWKRALDITLILLTAPLWMPLMVITAAIIKTVSPGPALFRQERVGYLGRRFICFKFRTMVVNADVSVHRGYSAYLMGSNAPMRKLDAVRDPRVIPGGLLLRALGLDELPQLFNVLRGDMSLVGPRPCVPYEYENYTARHRQRFEAVPGLTGLWQVSGKDRTTFEQMIDLDLEYARRQSLMTDLAIIVRTVPAIVSQAKEVSEEHKPVTKALPRTTVMQS